MRAHVTTRFVWALVGILAACGEAVTSLPDGGRTPMGRDGATAPDTGGESKDATGSADSTTVADAGETRDGGPVADATSADGGGADAETPGSDAEVADTGGARDGSEASDAGASGAICGDGIVGSGEQCDDGNAVTEPCAYGLRSCTVCTASCANGPGITSYCGDARIDPANGEGCDDGNTQSNDGCSSACVLETFADCSSLSLDGIDDVVVIPDGPATSAFTIEAWIQGAPLPAAPAFGTELFGTRCGNLRWAPQGFHVEIFPACNGTGTRYTTDSGPALPFTQFPSGWFHVAMVVPAQDQVRIYVDGQLAASSNNLLLDNGVNGNYVGTIGATLDMRNPNTLYNLSRFSIASFRASQIARYTQAFTPSSVLGSDPDTSVLYGFAEGSGTIANDASGAARHGTIRGGPAWSTQAGPGCTTACSDGTVELGISAWGRADIAFCRSPGTPALPQRISQGAAMHCASGWHVCTSTEFTTRNNALMRSVADFGGTLDDGDNCFAMNLTSNAQFDGSLDAVRSGFGGSCTGTGSAAAWGRQEIPACGPGGAGACGVLCCR